MSSIDAVAKKYPLPQHARRYICFFLACLKQITTRLPPDANDALLLAECKWRDSGENGDSLSDARVRILSRVSETASLGSAAEAPYRLVSFVLEFPEEGAIDFLEWFEVYLDRIGAGSEVFNQTLTEKFE